MFQQLIHTCLKPKKAKVDIVLFDIDLFYSYIRQCGNIIDTWYFQNVFTEDYWKYLGSFKYYSTNRLNQLHQGILCILLFKYFHHIQQLSVLGEREIVSIQNAVRRLHCLTPLTYKLQAIVLKSISSIEQANGKANENEILSSISWTIKHIILTNGRNKNINQR